MLGFGRVEVVFANAKLAAVDAGTASLGLGEEIDEDFRQLIDFILESADERNLRAMKSLHYEKLTDRGGDHSLALTDPWRLIFRLEGAPPSKKVVVVAVEDYHRRGRS
jgi:plasmid maintenance system killer protein